MAAISCEWSGGCDPGSRRRRLELRSSSWRRASRRRSRVALLAVEVALSLVLLLGAGLFLRSFVNLLGAPLGFSPERVTSFFVALPEARYGTPERIAGFFEQLEPELGAVPGVESVGGVLGAPLGRNSISTSFRFVDHGRCGR